MGKIKRLVGAYLFASGAAVVPGAIAAELLHSFGYIPGVSTPQATGALWLVSIGVPTIAAGWGHLYRELGNKAPIVVQAGGIRHIPVNNPLSRLLSWFAPAPAYALSDQAVGIWGARQQTPRLATLDVGEEIVLSRKISKNETISVGEGIIIPFIRAAYNRQLAGEAHPFSRNHFVYSRPPKIERLHYDMILDVLQYHHLVIGRRQGVGGRLTCAPYHALAELRHYYHSPTR